MNCPCGSSKLYAACCEPIIKRQQKADSAEALMRARYSAYATNCLDFVESTHAPDSRDDFDLDAAKQWAKESEWLGLEIVSALADTSDSSSAAVEFIASYKQGGQTLRHHEKSRFIKISNEWFFSSGKMIIDQVTRSAPKISRNDPCPCGSGKKYKKCCA